MTGSAYFGLLCFRLRYVLYRVPVLLRGNVMFYRHSAVMLLRGCALGTCVKLEWLWERGSVAQTPKVLISISISISSARNISSNSSTQR